MLKFLIPAIVIFLIVFFWERINEKIYKKFNIRFNYLVLTICILILGLVFVLLYF